MDRRNRHSKSSKNKETEFGNNPTGIIVNKSIDSDSFYSWELKKRNKLEILFQSFIFMLKEVNYQNVNFHNLNHYGLFAEFLYNYYTN